MPIALGFAGLLGLFAAGVPVFIAFLIFNIALAIALMGPYGVSIFAASILDTAMTSELVTVPLFILLGELLFRSGSIGVLFDGVDNLVGRIRGRRYVVVVAASVLLGALSGSAIAVAALLGRTVMPEALKRGSDVRLMSGLVLGGACLAPVIPPSILVVLIGMLSGTSISALLAAGVMPGLFAGFLFFLYIQYWTRRHGAAEDDAPAGPRVPAWRALLSLAPFSVVIFSVLGLILLGVATPTEAAACGVFGALLVAAIYRKLSVGMILDSLASSLIIAAMIMLIMASSKILTQLMAFSGVTTEIVGFFAALDLSDLALFLILMAIPFVACMFLDQIALMLILIPIYKPLIEAAGFDPIVFWTVLLLNLTLGAITPPFGYALFALKAAFPDEMTMGDVYRSAWPFIGLILLTLAVTWAFPQLATWLPGLL